MGVRASCARRSTRRACSGEPPWPGLDRLGTELGVPELNELAASVTLAGDEGARVRASIAAKARAMRSAGSPTPRAPPRRRANACRCRSSC